MLCFLVVRVFVPSLVFISLRIVLEVKLDTKRLKCNLFIIWLWLRLLGLLDPAIKRIAKIVLVISIGLIILLDAFTAHKDVLAF